MTALSLVALVGLGSTAHAATSTVGDRLDEVETSVLSIVRRADELDGQASPGRGFITESQALQRYQDSAYAYFIGNYEEAAEGFFSLVTTASLSEPGFHRDAEWLLAEALFEMGNTDAAEERYLVIAYDDEHPFREDGVRRLLELYARTDRAERFYELYDREIVRGRVKPSDLITYSVGRGFYRQGEFAKARSYLLELQPGSSFYRKARYHLGAMLVRDGHPEALVQAAEYFSEIAEMSVETVEDRQVHDLSLLALGRIYYELGDYATAADHYDRISGDSEFLADKLYEIVWTFIKQEEFQQALRGIEIFLLAYPEHQYTAQLQLLQGHLHYREIEYDAALSSYERVVDDYTPVQERFSELASSNEEPRSYFRKVLYLDGGTVGGEEGLPAYAVAMMMADPELARAITMYRELEKQESNLDVSDRLIEELSAVIGTDASIGGFENLRYDVVLQQNLAVDQHLALLDVEEAWLRGRVSPGVEPQLDALARERGELAVRVSAAADEMAKVWEDLDVLRERAARQRSQRDALGRERDEVIARYQALERILVVPDEEARRAELDALQLRRSEIDEQLSGLDAGDSVERTLKRLESAAAELMSELDGAIAGLRDRFADIRRAAPGNDREGMGDRLDALHDSLDRAVDRLRETQVRLADMESSELGRIRARFAHEVREVGSQRDDLLSTMTLADDVSIDLTRDGFGRLEDFFTNSIFRADVGIVDVYWAQKESVEDQKARVLDERTELVDELERRFSIIRQKLEQ